MTLKGSNKTEYQKEYMRRKRSNNRVGLTGGSNTYPAVIVAIADKEKREKLIRISNQLRNHRQLENVRYGINGPTFTEVDAMLRVLT